MKKYVAVIIIALGIFIMAGVTLPFHAYIRADNDIFNAGGDLVTAAGEIVGSWRDGELTMYLGTMRIIAGVGGGIVLFGVVLFFVTRSKTITRREVMATIFLLLGVTAVLGVLTVFYPCTDMMAPARLRPMRCVWTMRVLLGVLSAIKITSLVMLLSGKSREATLALSFGVTLLGFLFLLIPTMLTGVCASDTMPCVTATQPFTLVMSGLLCVVAFINTLLLARKREEQADEA
jgi:hypothetical protein